jgi:pimeloyl-ACP methyl ester carboxylesterase
LVFLFGAGIITPCRGQTFADFMLPLPLPKGSTLVIGFLGGWERWDDPHRGVRKLAMELCGTPGVYAETVSNHRQRAALALIHAAFDWNRNGQLDHNERAGARIILYGQSLGGAAAVNLARKLQALDIPVLLTVQVDSVGRRDAVIPANVAAAANLFQHDGPPIMGRTRIRAEDRSRTRILGNFQYHYWFKNVDMSSATWARKHLGGAHARMEQDPKVWARVERLIRQSIPQ